MQPITEDNLAEGEPACAETPLCCFAESEELARFLLEATRDCVLFLDGEGSVIYLNTHGQELLGINHVQRFLNRSWLNLLWEPARAAAQTAVSRASGGIPSEFQTYSPALTGEPKWWRITLNPLAGPGGAPFRYFVLWRDITEHMLAVKALRQSEEGFRKIFEDNPIGIVLSDLDCRITKVNNSLGAMLGFSGKELEGKDIRRLAASPEMQADDWNKLLQGETLSFQVEKGFLTKRGKIVWGHATTSIIRDAEKQPLYLLQMIENISDRKKSEEQLLSYQEQLQSLASELSLSEERERRRIATNLHDRIGQTLAFARLKLGALSQSPGTPPADAIAQMRELIEQAIVDTRSLTFDLSPPVLYELGLVPALEWLTRKIQQEHGIQTRFHDDSQPKPMDDKFRVVLFQAVRELLFNVVKHAQASHAQVLMRRDSDALRIIIEDDGKGFDPQTLHGDRVKGFGLFNIRERLEYLGGRMKVRSEPKLGTRITLMAPLKLNI